ncbi:UNVERIFIED_CONTAM: hypothetical protein GTU68_010028, partial [Idotea baltica]|nr:hypothetical protein [Idotea baltica]
MFRKIILSKSLTQCRVKSIRHNSSLLSEAKEILKDSGEGKILLEKDGSSGIATITIDNQPKMNAISGSMMTQLDSILDELEAWDAGKGVILRSAGNIFCSGGDLSQKGNNVLGTPRGGLLMATLLGHNLTRLFSLPLVTVSLVHGKAIGAGAEFTTSTDFRVFSPSGEVCFAQGRMGVTTGLGGGTRLVKILGPRLALDLLTTSRKLKGEDALGMGFADYLLSGKDNYSETKDWLCGRLVHHAAVIQALKKIVIGARDLSLEDSLSNEIKIFSPMWGGPLNLEAISKKI